MATYPISLNGYIAGFQSKLDALNINSLSISGYPKSYLEWLRQNIVYYLHIYTHVLEKLLESSNKRKEEISLVDYGAGNGLLGMFAKHCGFEKVYLNDLSETFIDASKALSNALNIEIDGFIEGDCETLLHWFKYNERPDAVVGTDVIEHVYSLQQFFTCMKSLNKGMVTVFTTASVTANPFKSRQLMKLQYKDEHEGSNADHAKPKDEYAGLPFKEIRKRMIKKNYNNLNEETINQLAIVTRGMNEKDILAATQHYLASGTMPQPLSHPTNTCDPVTGSWTERLVTQKEYEGLYKSSGFSVRVYNGFYNQWQQAIKGGVLKLANKTISLLGKPGNTITPFITLVGTGSEKSTATGGIPGST